MTSARIFKLHGENSRLQQTRAVLGWSTSENSEQGTLCNTSCHPNSTQNIRMAQQTYNRLCSDHFCKLPLWSSLVSRDLKEVSKGQKEGERGEPPSFNKSHFFSTSENHSQFSFLLAEQICEATQLQNMTADDNLPMYKNQSPFPGHANRRTYKNKALSPELQSKLCHQTLAPRLNTSAKSDKHLWTRVFQEEDCFQKNTL